MILRFPTLNGKKEQKRRSATASLEAVLTFGITFPVCGLLVGLGIRACIRHWQVIGGLVTWPY